MAKTKSTKATNDVDELLGNEAGSAAQAEATEAAAKDGKEKKEVTPEEQAILDQIKELQAKQKELKAQLKGEPVKKQRTLKGQMVAFKNKNGEQIVGLGVLYYVARHNGKLHYKEASQVTILPAEWKEGDPIPEPNVTEEQGQENA